MNIYQNKAFNEMLKNGTATIINHKIQPYRYIDISTIKQAVNTGGEHENSGDADDIVRAATDSNLKNKILRVPLPGGPLAEDDRRSSPDTPCQTALTGNEQSAQSDAASAADGSGDPQDEVLPVTAQSIVLPDDEQSAQPDAASVADGPGDPQDEASSDAAQSIVLPDDEQSAQPDAASVADGPGDLQDEASSDAAQSMVTRIIQPDCAPGGLIAEIHFEDDLSGQALQSAPGYISCSSTPVPIPSAEDSEVEEDPSYPPYINFIAFNRLGLTIKNLTNLLDSDEDFELNIIDCNSNDNSWDYIQSLDDPRIKSRIHFDKNCGPIFATNFALSRRKPYQYFIVVDSDTFIKTKNWIARFMEVFNTFPEVGLLGLTRDNPYPKYLPPVVERNNGSISYLQLKNADIDAPMDFIPGQLQCLRPRLIKEIGYWSEENGFGDAEISPRITHYTNFTVGFITTIEIDMTQRISCEECGGQRFCTLDRNNNDCFLLCRLRNKNELFVEKNTWKFKQTFQELKEGQRTAYCASIHDPESVSTHKYNSDWAYENFNHYIINTN